MHRLRSFACYSQRVDSNVPGESRAINLCHAEVAAFKICLRLTKVNFSKARPSRDDKRCGIQEKYIFRGASNVVTFPCNQQLSTQSKSECGPLTCIKLLEDYLHQSTFGKRKLLACIGRKFRMHFPEKKWILSRYPLNVQKRNSFALKLNVVNCIAETITTYEVVQRPR